MVARRITILMDQEEADALAACARQELRIPRHQAHLLLRDALRERGLLPDTPKACGQPAPANVKPFCGDQRATEGADR